MKEESLEKLDRLASDALIVQAMSSIIETNRALASALLHIRAKLLPDDMRVIQELQSATEALKETRKHFDALNSRLNDKVENDPTAISLRAIWKARD